MSNYNYAELKYIVSGRDGFDLTTALRLWKTKYINDFKDFERAVITHESLHDFRDFVKEMWDDIEPISLKEAFAQINAEDRRTYFDAIGPEKLFKSLEPKLLNKQVIKKKRTRWDDKNDPFEYEFEDVYELYEIDGEKLFSETNRRGGITRMNDICAVRCWCTTTNREYWLYVPWSAMFLNENKKPDAISAIAWTIRIDIDFPERIYRQGDIIIVKMGADSTKRAVPRHLQKDEYLSLMYSET